MFVGKVILHALIVRIRWFQHFWMDGYQFLQPKDVTKETWILAECSHAFRTLGKKLSVYEDFKVFFIIFSIIYYYSFSGRKAL